MYSPTLLLAFSMIPSTLTASTVFENSDSERLRYFEFPDGDGQQQQQQQQPPDYGVGDGGDPLFRQGITNGTVVIVPSKLIKVFKAHSSLLILI